MGQEADLLIGAEKIAIAASLGCDDRRRGLADCPRLNLNLPIAIRQI
jgi:hypothetical protein